MIDGSEEARIALIFELYHFTNPTTSAVPRSADNEPSMVDDAAEAEALREHDPVLAELHTLEYDRLKARAIARLGKADVEHILAAKT